MKLFIAMLSLFTLALMGCTKEEVQAKLCDTGKTVAAGVSTQLATELSCSNVDAIKASIEEKLVSLKVCESAEKKEESVGIVAQSTLGDVVCAPLVEGILAGAVSSSLIRTTITTAPI